MVLFNYLSLYSVVVGALIGTETMILGKAFRRRPWGWAFLITLASAVLCQLGVEFLAPPF